MADQSQHPDVVVLAEYAEGLLDPAQQAAIDHHVRECSDCSETLAELAGLPETLAQAPVPPMPPEFAARLDQAIAAEARARASEWSGVAAARVVPMRPRRRWLAPVLAAAAVVGAIAIAVPVLNEAGSDDSTATSDTSGEDSEGGGAAEENDEGAYGTTEPDAPAAGSVPVALSSDSFGRDVLDAFYVGGRDLHAERKLSTLSEERYLDEAEGIPDVCALDPPATVPMGRVDDVTYDGEAAVLLRLDVGKTVAAIAYRCDAGEPITLDAVTLRPR